MERIFLNHEYLERERVNFPSRKFKIKNVLKILSGFFILGLILEALGILIGNITVKPVVAQWGTIEKGFWTEVLFLRDETLIVAPSTGELNAKLLEGTRIPRGEIVAFINTTEPNDSLTGETDLQIRLHNLKQKMLSLQEDYTRIKTAIDHKRAGLKEFPRNSKKAQVIDEDLALLEQEKARILRNIQMNQLETEQLKKKAGNEPVGAVLVSIDTPGFFYYKYDDWEGRITPDRFSELSPADFNRNYPLKSPGKQIKTGTPIGKIINPFKQTIALMVDQKQIGILSEGERWWYRVGEDTFQCTLSKMIQLTTGKILVALEDTFLPAELMPDRRAKIFLIYHRISGVTIPVQALFKDNQNTVVRVIKGDGYQAEMVSVLETDGIKAIITGIDFGTTIISR